jgi:hypothetical protein
VFVVVQAANPEEAAKKALNTEEIKRSLAEGDNLVIIRQDNEHDVSYPVKLNVSYSI